MQVDVLNHVTVHVIWPPPVLEPNMTSARIIELKLAQACSGRRSSDSGFGMLCDNGTLPMAVCGLNKLREVCFCTFYFGVNTA